MKLVQQLWQSLTELSTNDDEPIIVMHHNERIMIEQTKALLSFTKNKIVIAYRLGTIEISGDNLLISFMYEDEIIVSGSIAHIEFSPEERRER